MAVWTVEISGDLDSCIREITDNKNRCADIHTRLVRNDVRVDDPRYALTAAERNAIEVFENFCFTARREYKDYSKMVFQMKATGEYKLHDSSFSIIHNIHK
jgi:hypothetical protein